MKKDINKTALAKRLAIIFSLAAISPFSFADMASAKKWMVEEFSPSTLSEKEQMKEMQWFIDAAKPFKGMEINVASETITTHEYESKTLAKAFYEITGIKVNHDLIVSANNSAFFSL